MNPRVDERSGCTPLMDWAIAHVSLPGENVSGDRCVVAPTADGLLIGVIDGIGHGPEAAKAADAAVELITKKAQLAIVDLVELCHDSIRRSRGVVMSLARINAARNTMTWTGVGNVEGVLIPRSSSSGSACMSVPLRGGVVGSRLPILQAQTLPLSMCDLLVLATDGVHPGFVDDLSITGGPQQIANRILTQHSRGNDDALVFVGRYMGGRTCQNG